MSLKLIFESGQMNKYFRQYSVYYIHIFFFGFSPRSSFVVVTRLNQIVDSQRPPLVFHNFVSLYKHNIILYYLMIDELHATWAKIYFNFECNTADNHFFLNGSKTCAYIQNCTKQICHFLKTRRSCLFIISMRLFLVTMSSSPCLLLCLALRCCSCKCGELRSCGGSKEPVGFTRSTMSRNKRLLLLFMKVMAVPRCPSLPARPICQHIRFTLHLLINKAF